MWWWSPGRDSASVVPGRSARFPAAGPDLARGRGPGVWLDRHGSCRPGTACTSCRRGRVEPVSKRLSAAELEELTASTLAHYDRSAEAFEAGTRAHDVSQ